MASTEKKKQYDMQYNKLFTRQVTMRLTRQHDADILEHLSAQKSMQGYIKALIRADIARANSTIMKEDETMKYNANETTRPAPTFDHDPLAIHIHDEPAQNLDNPGIPAGTGERWYAVVQDEGDAWSTGSEDPAEALRIAQNIPGAKVLDIDNSLDHPFISDEIDPRRTYHVRPDYLSDWGDQTTEDTVITELELYELARDWEKDPADLRAQLEEI